MTDTAAADPLERLESLLDRIQEAKDQYRLGDALDAAVRSVHETGSAISHLEHLAGYALLMGGFLDSSDLEELGRLLGSVKEIGRQLKQTSDYSTLEAATAKVSLLQGQVNQVRGLLHRGWKTKIHRAFSATGRLGSVLREIPETNQLGLEMESLFHAAELLAASIDDAERSAEQFGALMRHRGSAKGKLVRLGAGVEVVTFLSAVAERTASLANLTAEVRGWLEERNALERFKVSL